MVDLIFASSNYSKAFSFKSRFRKIDVSCMSYFINFNEPQVNDIFLVSKSKAIEAYGILNCPCCVDDSGFSIDEYPNNPGYPGAFAKRSGISNNIDELLIKMKDVKNRTCRFTECITFYDGNEFYQFFETCEGTLAYEKRGVDHPRVKSNLWFVFVPSGQDKTLAEMTDIEYETYQNNNHVSAVKKFAKWYKEEYLPKRLKLC